MKLITTLFFCTFATSAFARILSVNFESAANNSGDELAITETAGVRPVAQWNNINVGAAGTTHAVNIAATALKDDTGAITTGTISTNLGSAYIGSSGSGQLTTDRKMMSSYMSWDPVDGSNPEDTGTITIANLPANYTAGYSVYVYFDADVNNRTFDVTINGTTITGADATTFNGTYKNASTSTGDANYAVFTGLTASSFTVAMNSNTGRAAINGIQIVSDDHPVPPTIQNLTADDYYVSPGTNVTIEWETDNATSITLNPGNIDLTPVSTDGNGSISINVTQTTTYTLTASNDASQSASKTIRLAAGAPKPNIVFFLVDDMGWQDTSVVFHYDQLGNPQPTTNQTSGIRRTPNMAQLASQGMIFTNAYSCSVCTPTRASIMTGMNATRHHITTWTHPSTPQNTGNNGIAHLATPNDWRKAGMDATDIPLPKLLQDTGYRTIHSGKAHFGSNGSFAGNPQAIGFDINIAGHGAGGPGSYYGTSNYGSGIWQIPGLDQYHGSNTFLSEALTLEMKKEIENSVTDGVPFFSYMAHYAVHVPWQADSRFTANYPSLSGGALAYATLIEGMDKSLGDLITKLEELGQAENTLIIFFSDNGSDASNPVLRGKKGNYWEGGIRVPLIAAWAKRDVTNPFQMALPIAAASREDDIVVCEDMFATVADIAGASYNHDTDSHTLTPYFKGIAGTHRPQEFIQHFPHGHNHDHFALLRQGDWKIIHQYGNGSTRLYNLVDDINESTDLAAQEPEQLMSMTRYLIQRLDEMGAQYSVNTNTNEEVKPKLPNLPNVDVDNDGVPDLTEDANGNGIVDAGETDPDNDNTDGDNLDDGKEAAVGTDPLDKNSYFNATLSKATNGTFQLTWPSAAGASFTIQSSTDGTDWTTTVASNVPASSSGNSTTYNVGAAGNTPTFYRIKLE